jgi:hypothetical protein
LGDTLNEDGSSFWKDNWKLFDLFPRRSFMFKSPFFATKTEQFGQIFKGVLFCICSQFLVPLQRINELNLTDYPPHWPNLVHFQESKRFERMKFSPNELVTTAVDNLLEVQNQKQPPDWGTHPSHGTELFLEIEERNRGL